MSTILYHGGMGSGKSDIALSQIDAYENFGLRTALFQPRGNTRDVFNGKPIWRSRSGGLLKKYAEANWYESGKQVLELANQFDVFGFEEHHWYPQDYLDTIQELDSLGKIVVCVGLDYYHNGKPVENFWNLKQKKGVRLIEGVSAFCQVDLKNGKKTLAERTQLLVDGEPAFFDTPTDVAENKASKYSYYPVSIKNWQILPPQNTDLMHQYKRYYLDHKQLKC